MRLFSSDQNTPDKYMSLICSFFHWSTIVIGAIHVSIKEHYLDTLKVEKHKV